MHQGARDQRTGSRIGCLLDRTGCRSEIGTRIWITQRFEAAGLGDLCGRTAVVQRVAPRWEVQQVAVGQR